MSADPNYVQLVPFKGYNWTFNRVGWLPWNPIAYCLIASFCAVAYWMSIELIVLVYVTFKRRTSLYFWSIIITTIGIILQTTGYILFNFENSCPIVLVILICKVGWVSNVTGFSIVLWSRLHLIVTNQRLLKWILILILVNGFICHTPVVVFEFGLRSKHHDLYYRPMQIMERIQQTVFTLQETFISGLYIYHTKRFLNIGYPMHTRKVIGLLLCVQVLVVALDATLTAFDYSDMFTLKCTVHPFVYSIKLKLEFIVLNQLQSLVKRGMTPGLGNLGSALSVTDSRGSDPPPPGRKSSKAAAATTAGPGFDRGFITKADAAAVKSQEQMGVGVGVAKVRVVSGSSSGSGSESGSEPDVKLESGGASGSGSEQGEFDEQDLKNVVGTPDDDVGDIERQYLGRWEAKA